jgi:exodeoxyribonuclease V alpha subunit
MLLSAFLKAVPPQCKVVLIGDKDQLPSVSAGNVLSDIIESGSIPCTRLHVIFRQAAESRIVMSAHSVLNGGKMTFDQSLESDCMMVQKESPEEIAEAVRSLYSNVLPNVYGVDVFRETVVLCPSKKGPAGVTALNPLLQKASGYFSETNVYSHGFHFCRGDRVMQLRNDYELAYRQADGIRGLGVFNGELGVVTHADPKGLMLTVELDDGRTVQYDKDRLEELDPAYAITVHKSQGSEFPIVILAVSAGPPMLNNRNLLYTAITRARKKLFVVADKRSIEKMIRNRSQAGRDTSLREFMEIFACGGRIGETD